MLFFSIAQLQSAENIFNAEGSMLRDGDVTLIKITYQQGENTPVMSFGSAIEESISKGYSTTWEWWKVRLWV